MNRYKSTSNHTDPKISRDHLSTKISDIDNRIQILETSRANLLQQYTERYPFVESVDAKISKLENEKAVLYKKMEALPEIDDEMNDIMRDIYSRRPLLKSQPHPALSS